MRDVPYIPSETSDDLHYGIIYNGLGGAFEEADIKSIIAEVCGENDGADWYWVVALKNGKFAYISGGCDYTGWDCQSGLAVHKIADTAEEAVADAPEKEEYNGRAGIKKNLLAQIAGTQPFALYTPSL